MNRPKAIGTAAETAVVRWLRSHGWPAAERRALRGEKDAGDITGIPGICWEIKAGDAAHQISDTTCDGWMRDTELERRNAGADHGVLILRRKGKSDPGDWWAYTWVGSLVGLINPSRVKAEPATDFPVRMRLSDITALLHAAGYGDETEGETA